MSIINKKIKNHKPQSLTNPKEGNDIICSKHMPGH